MASFDEGDELNRPLGLAPSPRQPIPYAKLALAGCGVLVIGLIAFLIETDDRMGGEPFAVAAIERETPAPTAPVVAAADRAAAPAQVAAGQAGGRIAASEVEAQSGVKVVRAGNAP